MRTNTAAIRALGLVLVFVAGAARAEMPVPTASTPTLYGGERLEPGSFVLGATTGYPETKFDLYFGMTPLLDLGVHLGLTYGNRLTGNRQRVGMDLHVPIRLTLLEKGIVSGGLRLSPYFMIGEGSPAVATGADIGFLVDIALPKIFKIIVGPEVRTGFASVGNAVRVRGYDGGSWVDVGVETLLFGKMHAGGIFRGGAQWGRLGVDGVFNVLLYFGYRL